MSQQRIIAHFDLDSFFVSVEILNNPDLKGKPVIVGGKERGVVAACSYEARKFGIHSAMPSLKARQLCPDAIFISGSRGEYSKYSQIVTSIIAGKAPVFEKASIDEFYIDLTGMDKYFEPLQWTKNLREEIIDATKLPISFGLSSNKMMAKIATNQAKPNGFLQIPFGKEKEFLAPLPAAEIPGVGKQAQKILQYLNINTIHDITLASDEILQERLGNWGVELKQKAEGKHFGKVENYHEAKSISTENTFGEPVISTDFLMKCLVSYTEKVCYELRKDEKLTGCVAVKIRYPNFETTSKQVSIDYTNADDEIIPIVKDLFNKLHKKGEAVRLLGVRLTDLTNDVVQASLFSDYSKKNNLYKSIDAIKNKFGKQTIQRAGGKNKPTGQP
jgi:DNA polymerase IV